ncbi:tRNA (adenosine(37)-N6)-threonylcarbamoyltransferase complex transferase subunit TsaD [Candidatus Pacearchaeota archaeon]|nr:tRNA (adenosine(37)-N6)-threonylcarbamoyltransferase complex transferase subunit TsaD [Candidatus Pacearchaeota archaeon]
MIIGIECTAHTFGVGIVHKGKILANIRDMFMTESGGIVPIKAAEHHKLAAESVWNKALEQAGIEERDIEYIALANAPGLAPCLLAGLHFAREKAVKLGVKIVLVNHCIAHLEIGQSLGAKDPVLLYASGANTQILAYESGKYRVFGETLDIGIGNLLDKVARYAGLGFPGGPKLEKEAVRGRYIELPYSIKGMDAAFSGLATKAQQLLDAGKTLKDVAFSIQETAFAMLVEASERALAHTGKKELVLGGGVACNARLQEMCKIMCKERKARFYCPEKPLLVDNGAMIAYTGEVILRGAGKEILLNPENIDIKPRERTDEVDVSWR